METQFLNEKIIIVVGGLGLLGREFVNGILENGGCAVVADVDRSKFDLFSTTVNSAYQKKLDYLKIDITCENSINQVIETVNSKNGKIDAVVNTAYPKSRAYGSSLETVTYLDFCENLNLNIGGYFLVLKCFSQFFKTQGNGNIISLASVYGVISPRFDVYEGLSMTMPVEYSAIKSALIHLNKYFMRHYEGAGIRFNCISPGGVLDGQDQKFLDRYNKYAYSKGMLDASDVVGTLIYLLSDFSKFVNGQNIIVDDGWSV
ncbi:oxidoreductase [Amylibacter sp.]|nr:oxidoreductase [Amylibacter sp.]